MSDAFADSVRFAGEQAAKIARLEALLVSARSQAEQFLAQLELLKLKHNFLVGLRTQYEFEIELMKAKEKMAQAGETLAAAAKAYCTPKHVGQPCELCTAVEAFHKAVAAARTF